MKMLIFFIFLGLAVCLATPHDRQKRATSCSLSGSSIDSLKSVISSCTSIKVKDLTVPAGKTLDLTGLKSGTTVTFKGTIKFGYKEWEGPLISVSGTRITIKGSSGNKIDGGGKSYWDGKGGNGGKTKPKFFKANKLDHSVIKNLNINNAPKHVFSINGNKNLTISSVTIDIKSGDSNGGHNTDGFDVSESSDITIKNCNVYNQDDCLAVNSVDGLKFKNNYCSGGHGISIGSVGGRSNNVVKNVEIANNIVTKSDIGLRIKTVADATGSVSGITFKNNTLSSIKKYGITIRGDYTNSGTTGKPSKGCPIKSITMKDITGSVDSSAYKYYILVAGASSWSFSNVKLSGGKSKNECTGLPSGSGLSC